MEMDHLTFENVDVNEINQLVRWESKFNTDLESDKKGEQTSISDFI